MITSGKLTLRGGAILLGLMLASTATAETGQTGTAQPSKECLAEREQSDKDISAKLDKCDGVLKPPKVGDSDNVETAPVTGTMPVIKPGELPQGKNP
ncbi:hypothetical protein O9X98_30725 [Agrobacterium salinitolerans]|nr:hypothetical protein [Agrobacterium salinitolerans]